MPHDYVKQSELIAVKCGNGTSRHNITLCSTYFGLCRVQHKPNKVSPSLSSSESSQVAAPTGLNNLTIGTWSPRFWPLAVGRFL